MPPTEFVVQRMGGYPNVFAPVWGQGRDVMMDQMLIERAGRMIKTKRLARTPGMDIVAVKLNNRLTSSELSEAREWARAFELAVEPGSIVDLAIRISEDTP